MDPVPAPALRFEAVVFDMDGLLLDSERLAMRGLAEAADAMGVEAPEAFRFAMIGVPTDRCRTLVAERFGPGFPADAFLAAAGERMAALVEAGELQLKPGVAALLDHLDAIGMARAVATSSSRAKAQDHLRRTGILARFDVVVTRDDVARGKPHPDLFLRAAWALGREPACCLALEDSHNGIRAAVAAAMPVVMVPDLLPPTPEMRERCLMVATDLDVVRLLISRARADPAGMPMGLAAVPPGQFR